MAMQQGEVPEQDAGELRELLGDLVIDGDFVFDGWARGRDGGSRVPGQLLEPVRQ